MLRRGPRTLLQTARLIKKDSAEDFCFSYIKLDCQKQESVRLERLVPVYLHRSACEYVEKWTRQVWKYTEVLATGSGERTALLETYRRN
jgi:hypothetical protein